jgi:hypothetical protein
MPFFSGRFMPSQSSETSVRGNQKYNTYLCVAARWEAYKDKGYRENDIHY